MTKKITPTKLKKSKSNKTLVIDDEASLKVIQPDVIGQAELSIRAVSVDVVLPIEVKKRKGKPPCSSDQWYVDPKDFDNEIVAYYDSGKMSDALALMVDKIANKLSYASNFINYTFREEMVGDANIRMFKALMSQKYDRVKGTNPFAYFTRIAFNAFRNRIKKEKRMRDAHTKYQEEYEIYSANYNMMTKNCHSRNKRDGSI